MDCTDQARFRVILDSLDGSKNFLASTLGLFGICAALEQENAKLKRLLADAELDKAALKDLLGRKW